MYVFCEHLNLNHSHIHIIYRRILKPLRLFLTKYQYRCQLGRVLPSYFGIIFRTIK